MKQTRRQSAIEALAGTGSGLVVNAAIVYVVVRWVEATPELQTLIITSLCTVSSLARGYGLRRWFNKRRT